MARQCSLGLQSTWLSLVEAAFFDGNCHDANCINDGRAVRWCLNEESAAQDEDGGSNDNDPMVVSGFNHVPTR